ncbi:hypothetical protein Tco_0567500 [Tanacetum coccineum]
MVADALRMERTRTTTKSPSLVITISSGSSQNRAIREKKVGTNVRMEPELIGRVGYLVMGDLRTKIGTINEVGTRHEYPSRIICVIMFEIRIQFGGTSEALGSNLDMVLVHPQTERAKREVHSNSRGLLRACASIFGKGLMKRCGYFFELSSHSQCGIMTSLGVSMNFDYWDSGFALTALNFWTHISKMVPTNGSLSSDESNQRNGF